jgi:hypothetical protein
MSPGKPRLAGLTEIGEIAGMTRQGARRLASRPDFPQMIDRIAAGPVWDWDKCKAWVDKRKQEAAEQKPPPRN